jgi:hypothetical protein
MKILLTRSGVATPLAETTELSSDGREPHSGKNTPALFLIFIWLRILPSVTRTDDVPARRPSQQFF